MDGGDFETMRITFGELRTIKAAIPVVEEEDILRARIVSVQELLGEKEKWDDAFSCSRRRHEAEALHGGA